MKLFFLIIAAFCVLNCSNAPQKAASSSSDISEQSDKSSAQAEKVYQSDFNTGVIFEPDPQSDLPRYEPIFGKGISLKRQHISLSDKKRKKIKRQAGIENLSDDELKELSPDLFYAEDFPRFVYKGNRQLALVETLKIGDDGILIIYSSRDNQPVIREIRSDALPAEFLAQFEGKGVNDRMSVDEDISSAGLEQSRAKKIAAAIRIDFWIKQAIYGSPVSDAVNG